MSENGNNEACNISSDDVESLSGSLGDNSDEGEAISSSRDGVEILDEGYIPPSKRRR